ncbi:helix-turn-helix domain-containing protein [Solibacillus isronensis]|uniref:helix-turn-helix domain-containing protein n=1 Tax=Solibacillus isronensis TaxID=412383 RepID=UPI0039A252D4
MFIGENLKNLRILYGYSQPSLTMVTGILENDIWQYENGYKQPSFEHVNILKKLFNVRAGYFYREDLLNLKQNNIDVNHISFRFYE